jgi:hypothetical protein
MVKSRTDQTQFLVIGGFGGLFAANRMQGSFVGNFETAKASNFNKLQQLSTSSLQAVQHQTVEILQIQ